MTKVIAIKCPKCKDTVYSCARHDFRQCSCGQVAIDGGFDYVKVIGVVVPKQLEIDATRKDLFDDWNKNKKRKYGLIKGKK